MSDTSAPAPASQSNSPASPQSQTLRAAWTVPRPPASETVAQPLSKIVAIARTTRRRLQHLALDIIGLPRGFKAFSEASRWLARVNRPA